jgi:deoxyribose-phosphate aldolase
VSTAPLRLVTEQDRNVQIAATIAVPTIESEAQLRALLTSLSGVDAVGAEARAAKLSTRSIKKSTKLAAIEMAISMVDLTTLEGADTPGRVTSLCTKAMRPDPRDLTVPSVAAVCVYPDLVAHARSVLGSSPVAVASVATSFPSGRASLKVKLMDVREAVSTGADEIDAHLKVILETGELVTYDNVRRASWIAMLGGADFIKTSTGKVTVNATLPVALVMLEAVRDFAETAGPTVGVKVAGGIRTSKDAIRYLVLVNETVGSNWLTPNLFRFGASSLLNDLLMQRLKQQRGAYVRADEFSGD